MAILNFSLNPESLSKLHDALVCLGKFSEAVCIEAVHDKVHSRLLFEIFINYFIACSYSSKFLQVSICILYSEGEQVLLQVSI